MCLGRAKPPSYSTAGIPKTGVPTDLTCIDRQLLLRLLIYLELIERRFVLARQRLSFPGASRAPAAARTARAATSGPSAATASLHATRHTRSAAAPVRRGCYRLCRLRFGADRVAPHRHSQSESGPRRCHGAASIAGAKGISRRRSPGLKQGSQSP